MKKIFSKIGLAFSFALRDISMSRMVLTLTVLSLGMAYAVIFLSGGILSGFSEALKSGSIDSSGDITIYFDEKNTENEIREIAQKLSSVENIDAFSVRTYGGLSVFRGSTFKGSAGYAAIGIDPKPESMVSKISERVIEGRFLREGDVNKVVLGMTMADNLEGKLYDDKSIAIGEEISYVSAEGKKRDFEVIGIVDAKYFHPNWTNYFLKDDIEYLDSSRKNEEIIVGLLDDEKIIETKTKISENIEDGLVATWEDREGYVLNLIDAIRYITSNITILLIITTFILTSVFIFINVFQKRRQIGILKSMGASNDFIVKIYLFETFIFSSLSFAISITVLFLAHFVTSLKPLPSLVGDVVVNLGYADILLAFASLIVASIVGSLLPIYFAVKIQIADIIRNPT